MKLIIAGSRTFSPSVAFILDCIKLINIDLWNITEVVSGGANGIDLEGENFANVYHIPIKRFLPDWESYGYSAGPKRNKEMAAYSDALLLIWDGKSKGSASMLKEALARNIKVYEVILRNYE